MPPSVMLQSTTFLFKPACCFAAVNPPGTAYTLNEAGPPDTISCPEDRYGPGLKKQRACVPRPPGYTTNGTVGQRSVRACGKKPATGTATEIKHLHWSVVGIMIPTCAPLVGLQSATTHPALGEHVGQKGYAGQAHHIPGWDFPHKQSPGKLLDSVAAAKLANQSFPGRYYAYMMPSSIP